MPSLEISDKVNGRVILDPAQFMQQSIEAAILINTHRKELPADSSYNGRVIIAGIGNNGEAVLDAMKPYLMETLNGAVYGFVDTSLSGYHLVSEEVFGVDRTTHLPTDVDRSYAVLVAADTFNSLTLLGAIKELFALGRPKRVDLVTLVNDPGRRVIPLHPNLSFLETEISDQHGVYFNAASKITRMYENEH